MVSGGYRESLETLLPRGCDVCIGAYEDPVQASQDIVGMGRATWRGRALPVERPRVKTLCPDPYHAGQAGPLVGV